MTDQTIEKILQSSDEPETIFRELLPQLGKALNCDRVFLYLRSPFSHLGKVPFCWRRSSQYPEILDSDWKPEPDTLVQEDPMFAAAVEAKPTIFIEDVETADSRVVNRDFEAKTFGHRALIHAHLCQDDQLWGILQPCVFDHPRLWSETDRTLIDLVTEKIAPLAVTYVQEAGV